jgi:hypothetical protein
VHLPLTPGELVEIRGPLSVTGGRASGLSRPGRAPAPGEVFRVVTLDLVDAFVQSTTDPGKSGAIARSSLSIARP